MSHEAAVGGSVDEVSDSDLSTRNHVVELIVANGPVSVATLATELDLTTAAIRRHVAALEALGRVEAREDNARSGRRGRPAKLFVATSSGHTQLTNTYQDLATEALTFLAEASGPDAVVAFAEGRLKELETRYAPLVTGPDPAKRAQQLADALSADGYVATVRPVPGSMAIQLCQGHCPVQHVAAAFPELCEAESKVFTRLIGSHTQRLITLAGGGHACTTHIPIVSNDAAPQVPTACAVEGKS